MSSNTTQQSTWSIRQIVCNYGGADLSKGFADGDDVIAYASEEDLYDVKVGADGTSVLYEKNNNAVRPKIKFMQGSQANATLSSMQQLSRATPGGLPAPFYYNDPSTGTTVSIPFCLLARVPDRKFGVAPNEVEWVFIGIEDVGSRFDGAALPIGI